MTTRTHDNRDMADIERSDVATIEALRAELARAYKLIDQLREDVMEAERSCSK